ncbi:MAG: outer membrane beta-barrel protein [Pseudomonadota bacterium]
MTHKTPSVRLFAGISLAAFLAMGAAAFAADAIDEIPQPPIAPPPGVEVFSWQGGYIGASAGAAIFNPTPGFATNTGFIGGAFAGYNFQNGNVVFAPELDFDYSATSSGALDLNYVGRVKGKLGYSFDRTLVSVIGGGAFAGADAGAGALTDFGWLAGASVDYAVTDNIFAGGEYLYHSFDNFDSSGIDVNVQTIKARVGFKF